MFYLLYMFIMFQKEVSKKSLKVTRLIITEKAIVECTQ